MKTVQTVIAGLCVAWAGKVGAAECALGQLSVLGTNEPRKQLPQGGDAPAADSLVPADMYIYIVMAVLVFAVIALVVLILRKNKSAVDDAVTYCANGVMETYPEELPPSPAGPQLRVTYLVKDGEPVELSLRYSEVKDLGNRLIIGRSRSSWLVVPDPYVSRKHIELYARGGNFWVRDCGSTGGTTLNRIPLDKDSMPLKDGDQLVLSAHANLRVYITPA